MTSPSSQPLLRRLRHFDTQALGDLLERSNVPEISRYYQPFPLTRETAATLLDPKRRDLFFGAVEQGRLSAFSMLRGWDEGFDIPSFGILVDPACQGLGLGRYLTEWTLRWADQAGCAKVRLTVFEQNNRALELYRRLGFMESERRTHADGRLNLVMHRPCTERGLPLYVSTQTLPAGGRLTERLAQLEDAGLWRVELSNCPVQNEQEFMALAEAFPGRLMLHHFFPSGDPGLVLNLSSSDSACREATLRFFKRSIDWSARIHSPYFSFHAGYVTDPVGRDAAGFCLAEPGLHDYEAAWQRFGGAVHALADYAADKNVRLLIENNVAAAHNQNKLLLSTPSEFLRFYRDFPELESVGILLDWGHWLVSARTFGLKVEEIQSLQGRIGGLHLHTNNGVADTHQAYPCGDGASPFLSGLSPAYITLEGHYSSLFDLQGDVLRMEKEWT